MADKKKDLASTNSKDPVRVLLVEDNQINAITLIHSLKLYGYEVLHAITGIEACEISEREHPDLIVMDIQLPEMDGLTATRHIRTIPELKSVPIIALTAIAMPGDKERCLEAGANAYLSKPVRLEELLTLIKALLQNES